MNIACITVFCNERFRLENWIRFYSEYKEDISLHIIVNNGDVKDTDLLRQSFPNSVVLESEGGNLLKAYNVGTSYALNYSDVDAIMQITNDVRFESGAIKKLYELLFSDEKLAVVGPVLLKSDSQIVESYGIDYQGWRHYRGGGQKYPYSGQDLESIKEIVRRTTYVPAGTILQKRSAIEKMGLQDDAMNMYCDERDMFIRLDKLGYYEAVTINAKAWHQHINRPGYTNRSLFAPFYSSRNGIYLVHKHANLFWAALESVRVLLYEFLLVFYHLINREPEKLQFDRAVIAGTCYGLLNIMNSLPRWLR
jgi:GT2 family glycosyltransferase